MQFESTPGKAALAVMEHEVDKLLKGSGVSLGWRLARQNRGNEAFTTLVLLKFKGDCRAEPSGIKGDFGSLGETRALGATKVAHGRVLPYTEVECDQIREALSYLGAGTDRQTWQKALGLAMGRVVAHELYHILAHTTAHAAQGLARATHSMEDLISPKDLDFQDDDARRIGEGVKTTEKDGANDPFAPPTTE